MSPIWCPLGSWPRFRNWVPKIGNCKLYGHPRFFEADHNIYSDSNHNLHIEIRHNILIQCHVNYIEVDNYKNTNAYIYINIYMVLEFLKWYLNGTWNGWMLLFCDQLQYKLNKLEHGLFKELISYLRVGSVYQKSIYDTQISWKGFLLL